MSSTKGIKLKSLYNSVIFVLFKARDYCLHENCVKNIKFWLSGGDLSSTWQLIREE